MRLGDKGNVSILVALCLPLLFGGAAYGIEVGYWRYDQVRLQQATDAAAYAGAVVKRADGPATTTAILEAAATAAAGSNGYNIGTDTITLNAPSTATPTDSNSVEVVIKRTETPIFTAYVRCLVSQWQNTGCSNDVVIVKASSTASFSTAGDACILALSPGASKAADFAGSSSITLDGCTVMSNSLASNAVNVQGAAQLTAPCIYAAGGAYVGGTVSLSTCPAVKTNQPPVADPFSALAMPASTGSCTNSSGTGSLNPGHYCSLTLKNNVSLSPGTYVIDGGALTINANANVTGSGVTFYLENGATVSMNGNSSVQLSAPTSGTYAGFLIVSDRSNTGSITINGTNSSLVTGTIYAPDGQVNYNGDFAGASGCTQIVAQTVSWSGDATFRDDCSAYGMTPINVDSVVRLSA